VYLEKAIAISELDIFSRVGKYAALKEEFILDIQDGNLDIEFEHVVENPKLNGIEVIPLGEVKPHYAHAVPGGPYVTTDINDTQNATIAVNGYYSHTHAAGAQLISWTWKVDDNIVATGEKANITLPVGEHTLVLRVEDTTGDVSEDFTTATVKQFGYPYIESLTPDTGEMIGGDKVTIRGSGFNVLAAAQTFVNFGNVVLSSPSEITIVDETTIEVLANPQRSWGKVEVTVTTPLDTSNPVIYEYLPDIPLTFKIGDVATGIDGPTTLAFDPRGNLYVATQGGDIIKYVLDEAHNVLETIVANATLSELYPYRVVLGIAFDPMDSCEPTCKAYVSHNYLFHGEIVSYNGVISTVSGPNLDIVEDIITGLPVSDHDHGINGMDFDDHGNLYVQVGGKFLPDCISPNAFSFEFALIWLLFALHILGNTNAGVPGALSSSGQQQEDLFSAATIIARNVNSPTFDGHITYDVNGDQTGGFDVSVFAAGMRNPFDLVYHSNGKLYGTDNGPNYGFGKRSISCTEEGPDPFEADKLNLIEEGKYYGHANRKRGESDPRQCVWRSVFEESEGYTKPIKKLYSSSNGICEFQSNHFGGALRGDLIIGRYKGALHHVKLTNEGQMAAGVATDEPPVLTKQGGLDVTQGPDGSLFVASNAQHKIFYQAPDEEEAELLTIKSIFPRRGPEAGNSVLTIYGQKMFNATHDPTVTVGGIDCPVSDTKIYTDVASRALQWVKCTLPSGVGSSDVVVSFAGELSTFSSYQYIPGEYRYS